MTAIQYKIRQPLDSDRAQWDPLWQGYLAFYKSSLTDAVTDLLWQRILDPDNEIQCRVAENSNTQLVGLVHFFPHANTWFANPVCYLNDLFVNPDIRGGGVGRMLIDAVVDEAARQGWSEIYWLTHNKNSVARGLYDKVTGGSAGFVNYSIDLNARGN
jgi:GNAT superfamily N-acetyltransferase